MKINREKALAAFQEYTDRYDSSRDMIRLKIEHTYRVCGLCQQIARSLELPEEEVDIAWLTGLLHDVGRFEQQRVYGTFTDADSIDHAKYGARILFGKVWEEKHGLASRYHCLNRKPFSALRFMSEMALYTVPTAHSPT